MPRPQLIRSSTSSYHVTARSNNRDWFYLPLPDIWRIFRNQLLDIIWNFGVEIHCFVLMSNHFHLLLRTPQGNIDRAMNQLLREVSRRVNANAGRINHVFGGPYHWSLIHSPFHFGICFKYVVRNPVNAGICQRVEDYPFSTYALALKGERPILLTSSLMERGSLVARPIGEQLVWLNDAYTFEEEECVKRSLRRKEFEILPDPKTRRIPDRFRM